MISHNSISNINSTLEINPYFATIVEEKESFYKLKIVFSILKSSIIKNDLWSATVRILDPNVYVDDSLGLKVYSPSPSIKTDSKNDPMFQVYQLLNQSQIQQNLAKKKKDSIIASAEVPLYYKISNISKSTIDSIKKGKNPKDFTEMYESVNALDVSKSSFSNQKSKNIPDIRQANIELLTKYKTDITEIFYNDYPKFVEIENLRKYYIGDILSSMAKDNTYYSVTKKNVLADRVFLKAFLDVPKSNALGENFFVEFYVQQRGIDTPIDIKKRSLDFSKLKSSFYSINARATLNVAGNSIVVKQNESSADGFILKRKSLNSSGVLSKEFSVAKESLAEKKEKKINFSRNERELFTFRCNSTNLKKNIVDSFVLGKVSTDSLRVDMTTLIVTCPAGKPDSIKLEVNDPPLGAGNCAVFRSKHLFGSSFSEPENVTGFKKISSKKITFEDKKSLENSATYKYQVVYLVGSTRTNSVSQIFKYVNSAELSGISVEIKNFSKILSKNYVEVQFSVSTDIKQSEVNKLYNQLKNLNLIDQFSQEFSKINDQFTELVSHKISRINLSTGLREEFGELFLDNSFGNEIIFLDNEKSQKLFSVSPIDPFTDYLYEVRTFLKNPVTLFSEYVKTVTVSVGKATKTYYYKPYKWMQKISKKTGSLLPEGENGEILLPPEVINEHNEIGVTANQFSEGLSRKMTIENLTVERIDQVNARVFWEITGDISDYDNFAIVKEVDKQKSFLGSTSSPSFIDKIEKSYGTVIYYVIPILKDLSVGTPRRSNSLIIDPQESI